MGGDEIIATVISVFVGVIVWIADSIAENAITDVCFGLIYDSAETVAQYDPMCGILIGMIPAIIAAGLTFMGVEAILKFFSGFNY